MLGGIGAGGEGDDRGWDGWMASPTWCTWVWVNSGSWWWTGRPGMLQSMGLQRVGHDWATELNWTEVSQKQMKYSLLLSPRGRSFSGQISSTLDPIPTPKSSWSVGNEQCSTLSNIPKIQILGDSFSWGNMQSYACVVWFADQHWNFCISIQNSTLHRLLVPKILSVR